jgi:nucleoside-diphosphate-sugar epimerase
MKLFIAGASGYIGGAVAQRLLADGHQIRGLVRRSDAAEQLAERGITPVLGTLDDGDVLAREARRADAVINAASSDHRAGIAALLAALQDTGKTLIHTSGSSVIGDDVGGDALSPNIFDEDTPFIVEAGKQARHALDNAVLAAKDNGVRGIVLCNSMIYGTGAGLHRESVQIPPLVSQARKDGVVHVVGQGINCWSNVHIEDVAELYALALKDAPAGAFYFVENGEASYAQIGQAIATRLGLGPVQPWTLEAASATWGESRARYSFGSNSRVRARRARDELGWAPRHDSVTRWIETEMPLD